MLLLVGQPSLIMQLTFREDHGICYKMLNAHILSKKVIHDYFTHVLLLSITGAGCGSREESGIITNMKLKKY